MHPQKNGMYLWVFALLLILGLAYYIYRSTLRFQPFVFAGSHLFITGGSSGIGLELAKEAARRGANVTIVARGENNLKSAHQQIEKVKKNQSQKVLWYSCDVSNLDDITQAINASAKENNNRIDALLCSAGVTHVHRFMESTPDHIARVMAINFNGSAYATMAALPYMKRQRKGSIVYVSSLLGLMGCPGYAVYCGSKFALRGFAEALVSELSPFNISVSVAVPSNVDTPMFEEEEKTKPPETKAIEQGQKPVPPKQVSDDIIKALENYRFIIPTGTDSWLVSNISAGFGPASFFEFLTQPVISGIGRLIVIGEAAKFRRLSESCN